jgi:type I site-specific restriction-modification system R (restriction) subunit
MRKKRFSVEQMIGVLKQAQVLEEIQSNPELKKMRVAFLIDEAHRSQEGQMGAAIRLPFREEGEPDEETPQMISKSRLPRSFANMI